MLLVITGVSNILQGGRNGFQSGGVMEHWKVLSATMVSRQEKFSNSRCSRMAKTIIFWPWWQPLNSFCFETLCIAGPVFHLSYLTNYLTWKIFPIFISKLLNKAMVLSKFFTFFKYVLQSKPRWYTFQRSTQGSSLPASS